MGYQAKSSFGFGLSRFEKPAPKERKESSKKSKEGLKHFKRTSIGKEKFKRPRKDEFSPKIALKSIKVVKNSDFMNKIHRKGNEGNEGLHNRE